MLSRRRFAMVDAFRPMHLPVVCSAVTTSHAGLCAQTSLLHCFSTARPKISFTGPNLSKGQLNMLKEDGKAVKSVSNWKWQFAEQFTELKFNGNLGLHDGNKSSMLPAMQVFSELNINEQILRDWEPPGHGPNEHERVYDHCEIEKVMKEEGFAPELDDAAYMAAPPAERKRMLAAVRELDRGHNKTLNSNEIMIDTLSDVRKRAELDHYPASKFDLCAQQFIKVCDFNVGMFSIAAKGSDFSIFGRQCLAAKSDFFYVVESTDVEEDLVLIIDDRGGKKSSDREPNIKDLGQVVGELLQILSLNRAKGSYRNVFGVRFINWHVTGFRVDTNKETLDQLVETDFVPDKKLQLECTVQDPLTDRGWSLINKTERLQALQMMANIRNFILKS